MIRRPPRSTRTATLFPYTTLFRSTTTILFNIYYERRKRDRVKASPKQLLATLRGVRQERPALWLMRQAGRYLPEYRALRETRGGFLELCYDPEAAAEVTLQPIRRFGFDGAIRSEERRVGKEGVSTWCTWGSAYH